MIEDAIEKRMGEHWQRPTGGERRPGLDRTPTAVDEYVAHLVGTIDPSLAGLKVVLDCAHGAASVVGPRALRDAGAEVVAICAEPDGLNINEGCGSTHLGAARAPCSSTAPTSASRSTATPTACLAVDAHGDGRRRRPDPGDPRARDARAGRPATPTPWSRR